MITGMAAALLAAFLFFPCKVEAVSAENAILLDGVTGRTLYEKQADKRGLIASTTKIMTALIVCEQCNVLDRMRIPKEAVGIEGSSMYLKEGEILTIQELLYGLMLHSGNDAAVALAIYCGGTIEGFAQLMNDKAHRLGLTGTHFQNPNGLDAPDHYSTARDLAVLTAYAMDNPIFYQTVSTKTVTAGGRSLRNHNKLLWRVEGADGVKTGFTKAAGRILVSSATRRGRRLIAVTMNAPNDWQDHEMLLEDGFFDFTVQQVISKGDILGSVEIAGGDFGEVSLVASEDYFYSLAKDESVKVLIQGTGFVYAPVVKDQHAGYAYICIGDRAVGKISVVYGDTVEQTRDEKRSIWDRFFGRTD
jgi:D-alanyl-D-alanine carboxypeptidase